MSRLDSTARLWNHGRAGDLPEDIMSDDSYVVHSPGNWLWIVAFARTIAPLINIKTGERGKIDKEEEAHVFVGIPAHGSPYQNNQCSLHAHAYQKATGYSKSSETLAGGLIIVNRDDTDTDIYFTKGSENSPFWRSLEEAIDDFVHDHYNAQRAAVGSQFNSILDHYYDSKADGKKVKLAALARQYNVNYNSLRQAKIRYDRKREERINLTDPASGEPEVGGLYYD